MENTMKLIPLFFVPLILLVAGCISGLDAEALAKASPIVQDFLEDHPNAEILATHFTANQSGMMLGEIREECANPYLEAKEYYRVRFTDPDTSFQAVVWIDWDAKKVECAYKKGEGSDIIEDCKSHHVSKCYGQHVYWFDSCDYKQEKKEYCKYGCDDGKCKSGEDYKKCEEAGGYCVYPTSEVTTGSTGMVHDVATTDDCTKNDDTSTCTSETVIYQECKDGYQRNKNYWCPENGICCIPEAGCKSHAEHKCYEDHVYWFDSCGHKQEKKEYCEHGCELGFCKKSNCEAHHELKCHDGHVYWYNSCGEKEEKKMYCEHGCVNGACLMEEADCIDSDNGDNLYEKGTATKGSTSMSDHCNQDGTLTEKFCMENEIKTETHECPVGYACEEGACVITIKECAEEGEQYSLVYTNEYPEHCCEGLTEWSSGMDTTISIGAECYETSLLAGSPIGTCIECGNQVCEEIEDYCNCPDDCVSGENSDYFNTTVFCQEEPESIVSVCNETIENLTICTLCQW